MSGDNNRTMVVASFAMPVSRSSPSNPFILGQRHLTHLFHYLRGVSAWKVTIWPQKSPIFDFGSSGIDPWLYQGEYVLDDPLRRDS